MTYLHILQLRPYDTNGLNISAAWWSESFYGDFMFKREKWVQLEGESMSSPVHRLVKFVPLIMHLNDFPYVMLF